MKLSIEKIKEEPRHLVFRLDLIPDANDDKLAIQKLESETIGVTDQMIQNIVDQAGNDLIKDKPGWEFDSEKKRGFPTYFIHLRESSEK